MVLAYLVKMEHTFLIILAKIVKITVTIVLKMVVKIVNYNLLIKMVTVCPVKMEPIITITNAFHVVVIVLNVRQALVKNAG